MVLKRDYFSNDSESRFGEGEITWYSNAGKLGRIREQGLEEDKITWFSTKNDTIQSKK